MTFKKNLFVIALGGLLVFGAYCLSRYYDEQRWLRSKAREITSNHGAHDERSQILALRDYVRRYVRHENAPYDDRPFFRATARETLESGRGYCGESSRAYINLLGNIGISSRRINLYGDMNHVIVEVRLQSGRDILVDPQDNDRSNGFFDCQDRELDQIVGGGRSLFSDYSTIHLRRIPYLGEIVQRVRLRYSPFTWTMENPWLIKALMAAAMVVVLLALFVLDKLLLEVYAVRLGVRRRRLAHRPERGQKAASTPLPSLARPPSPVLSTN